MLSWVLITCGILTVLISHCPAFCDLIDHLNCYNWVQKEARRYGEKWNKKWAREAAYNKILSEIPTILEKHIVVVDRTRFPSSKEFLADFLSKGV